MGNKVLSRLLMEKRDPDWELLGYAISSKYRTKILLTLSEGLATPTSISKKTTIRINHVSNVLRNLLIKELIECVNPNAKRGRLYKLTEKGENVLALMERIVQP